MQSLTVIFLIDTFGKMGGAERNLSLLSKELRERGYKVIIFCLKGGDLSNKMQNDGFSVENFQVNRIYDFKGIRALFRMVKIARHERASVIMTYHESSDFLGFLLAFFSRMPMVSSRRDMGFKLNSRHIWAYRLINRFFDHIATVSSAVKENILKTQWTQQRNITAIPNGVDLSSFTDGYMNNPIGIDVDDRCLNICCLANIRPIKAQKDLIDAADIVVRRYPSARFFLVGRCDTYPDYFASLQKQVRELGLEKVVKFTDNLGPSNVASLLASIDISVLSSLSEGMSNTILESMAAAKPVVATAVGGNPELVEDGKNGYLVPPGDSQSMAEALLKLLNDPELRYSMGQRSRSRVEAEFRLDRMIDKYEDLLQYVVLRKKLGRWRRFHSWLMKMIQYARSWIKLLLTSIIYYTGSISICRWIKRTFHRGRVKILCLHDISNFAKKHPQFSITIRSESFVRFLDFLAQNYQIVSLEEATRLLETGKSLTDDVFALTFDDCYKGWIDHVLPACQRLQVPYAIFIATGPLDSGIPLFYDGLIYLAENTWRKVADLTPWGLGMFQLGNCDDIFRFVEEIHAYWQGKSKEDRDQFLQKLSEYLGVSSNSENFQNMLLNWDDVHKMQMQGVTIGAHSVSHSRLDDLPEAECALEISQGKNRLEKKLGHPINFFAYPYGVLDYHKHDTSKIVAAAGFRNAFTLDKNNGNRVPSFKIGRRSVSSGMFLGPNGDFHKPLLATELCGLGDLIFGRVFKHS